jgi:hypothetical protein
MITDLVQIRRLGEKKHAENERFRKHLKSRAWAEKQLRGAAREIQEEMDCRGCAECCRVTEVEPTRRVHDDRGGQVADSEAQRQEGLYFSERQRLHGIRGASGRLFGISAFAQRLGID